MCNETAQCSLTELCILCHETMCGFIFFCSSSYSHVRKLKHISNSLQGASPRAFTFISIHRSYWSLGFRRLPHGLLRWIRFRELWRIWQGRVRGRGRCFLSRHRCSLIGHGACGDPSLTAALAVGSLPATRRVLLLSVLVLPTVTLVFVLANVPVVLEGENTALEAGGTANIYSLLTQH